MIDWKDACDLAEKAALEAGKYIVAQQGHPLQVENKAGANSLAAQVVTEVDRQSETIIVEMLRPFMEKHDIGLLGEEGGDDGSRLEKDYFWCIDPLDGTLAFIEGHVGASVAIALVRRDGIVMLGVVYDFAGSNLYRAIRGQGAQLNGNPLSVHQGDGFTWMEDRSNREHIRYAEIKKEIENCLAEEGIELSRHENKAGAVMNACWAIEQSHSVYFKLPKPKAGGGNLWDYAASTCIFLEAGGLVSDIHGKPLELNRKESTFLNHCGVLFCTHKKWQMVLDKLQQTLP